MTYRFMLDTDTVSFALRGVGNVADRIRTHKPSELCISALTLAELRYGAQKRASRKLYRLVETFADSVVPLPFDADAAQAFGKVACALAEKGAPIGTLDTLIAAHALSRKLVLVTSNERHFARVAHLAHESWR